MENEDESSLPEIYSLIKKEKAGIGKEKTGRWLGNFKNESTVSGFWPVIGSGELLGYLAIITNENSVDEVTNLTIGHALNVYAIQCSYTLLNNLNDPGLAELFLKK